jgi:predicted negative regulator of RcsB-dependent stress response
MPLGLVAAAALGVGAFVLTAAIVWMSGEDDGGEMVASPIEGGAETQAAAEPETEGNTVAGSGSETEADAVTTSAADTETQAESDSESDSEAEVDTEPATATETAAAAAAAATGSESPRDRANAIVEEADRLELPADAARALALYEEALEIDSINAGASAGVARVHLATNHPDQALEPAQAAVRLAPNRSGFKILLGDVHIALRDREAAREAWLAAYEIRPSARVRRRLDRIGYDPEGQGPSASASQTAEGGDDEDATPATSPTEAPSEEPPTTEPSPASEPTAPVAESETAPAP